MPRHSHVVYRGFRISGSKFGVVVVSFEYALQRNSHTQSLRMSKSKNHTALVSASFHPLQLGPLRFPVPLSSGIAGGVGRSGDFVEDIVNMELGDWTTGGADVWTHIGLAWDDAARGKLLIFQPQPEQEGAQEWYHPHSYAKVQELEG